MFFMKLTICICAIMGSFTDQKLCIITVTGTRNNTNSQAPIRARYPRTILSAPAIASTADAGSASAGNGTPAAAANPTIFPLKCPIAVIRKIAENRMRPKSTMLGCIVAAEVVRLRAPNNPEFEIAAIVLRPPVIFDINILDINIMRQVAINCWAVYCWEVPEKLGNASAIRVWLVLWKTFRALTEAVRGQIAESCLGDSDFRVLEALLHKGPLPVNTIGAKVELTPGSISVAVDRLEKRGLVKRVPDTNDRRVRMVHLTPSGKAIIGKVFSQHEAEMERLLRNVSRRERIQVIALLKKLGKGVESQCRGRIAKS